MKCAAGSVRKTATSSRSPRVTRDAERLLTEMETFLAAHIGEGAQQ
jgi:hypothetical protein